MVIIDPDIAEQERSALFERLGELIGSQSGYLVECDEWGTRKLAYEIKKKPRGYYARLDYCGSGELVKELERNLRIEDRFLKYMTVLLQEEADVEALKAEAARKEEEAAAAEAEKKAAEAEKKASEEAEAGGSESVAAAPTPETEAKAPAAETEAEAPEPEAGTAPDAPAPSGESEVKEEG
jgi:small subunit ribosomal protein S6